MRRERDEARQRVFDLEARLHEAERRAASSTLAKDQLARAEHQIHQQLEMVRCPPLLPSSSTPPPSPSFLTVLW